MLYYYSIKYYRNIQYTIYIYIYIGSGYFTNFTSNQSLRYLTLYLYLYLLVMYKFVHSLCNYKQLEVI